MGITKMALKCMLDDFNKRGGRPFGKLLTISKYKVVFDVNMFNHITTSCGWDVGIIDGEKTGLLLNDEILFNALGFESLETMDYSDYEGADIIHDLNDTNLPENMIGKYDFIVDGGTIEHIFHLPNVFENIYRMLAVGGTFFFELPVNNRLNHGFYNFSPCFVYYYFTASKYKINAIRPFFQRGREWLELDTVLNDPNTVMDNFGGMLIYGSVTKTAETIHTIPFQVNKFDWNLNIKKRIREIIKNSDDVYFYGTGNFVSDVISMLPLKYRNKVSGLLSNEESLIGTYKYGYKVYGVDEIFPLTLSEQISQPTEIVKVCTVIIATERYQEIVYNRIKYLENDNIKIIRLF